MVGMNNYVKQTAFGVPLSAICLRHVLIKLALLVFYNIDKQSTHPNSIGVPCRFYQMQDYAVKAFFSSFDMHEQ